MQNIRFKNSRTGAELTIPEVSDRNNAAAHYALDIRMLLIDNLRHDYEKMHADAVAKQREALRARTARIDNPFFRAAAEDAAILLDGQIEERWFDLKVEQNLPGIIRATADAYLNNPLSTSLQQEVMPVLRDFAPEPGAGNHPAPFI